MRISQSRLLLIAFSFTIFSCSKEETEIVLPINQTIEEEVLSLVNQHRADQGLYPLVSNPIIQEQARNHSNNMATGKVPFSHDGFDDRVSIIRSQVNSSASAENVARNYSSAAAVLQGWLESSGHKKNIEGNYNLTGIGIIESTSGDLYFTQIFIKQ